MPTDGGVEREAIATSTVVASAHNPIVKSIYTADPSAHVWSDGRLYVYASHDVDPNLGCDLMDRYHVYSTEDMVSWRDEGEIVQASQVPWGRPEGGFMWAPDAAYKNGTYYFYFPHPSGTDWGATWKIGVATSSNPASGFTVQSFIPGLEPLIDPQVFQDDDGQDYLYYGGGGIAKGGRLGADMMSINGQMQNMVGLDDFHEATWVFKRNGLYYLTYADNFTQASGGDNRMRYATSASPLGPWTYRGVLMDPTDSFCAHGSVVQYKGNWYVFYFTSNISGNDWLRSIAVDQLYFNPDGTLQTVVPTTTGVAAVGPPPVANPDAITYEAENAIITGAVTASDPSASGSRAVQNLHVASSTVQLNNVNGGNGGRAELDFRYATAETSKFRLAVNGIDYSFINALSTGGWSSYSGDATFTVPLNAGTNNTIIVTGGFGGVNLDYVKVASFNEGSAGGGTKYEAESGTVANGAVIANDGAASGGQTIQNLHSSSSYVELNGVAGGSGGTKTLTIRYASAQSSSLTINVNGSSTGSVNLPSTGGWSTYTGSLARTVTLNGGSGNTVRLVGGNGGVNVDFITIQ